MVLSLISVEWIALVLGIIGSTIGGYSLYVTINTSRRLLEIEEGQLNKLKDVERKASTIDRRRKPRNPKRE